MSDRTKLPATASSSQSGLHHSSATMPALSGIRAGIVRRAAPSRAIVMMLDIAIVAVSVMFAYLVRFEGHISFKFFYQMLVLMPVLALARLAANGLFGVYRVVWLYVGLYEALRFAQAVFIVSAVLAICRAFVSPYVPWLNFPYSIVVMEGMFALMGMTGVRFLPRIVRERRVGSGTPTLLVGAGQGGVAIIKEASRHPEFDIKPIGFVDDDLEKQGMEIANLRVLGTLRDTRRLLESTGAMRVVITSSNIPSKAIARIMDAANPLGVDVRIVTGLYEGMNSPDELAAGTAAVREVRIEDLLSRDPIPPSLSMSDLSHHFGGKRIMVTGAGGSIGSEMCRQLALLGPAKLLMVERDETNLFEIERELMVNRLEAICQPVLLDLLDARAVERAFKEYQPQVVFHAAAYKHVPMMERFPWEAVRNNIFSTKQLIELANENGVESFVMISTDKAINPTSVMGATKRMAEQVVQDFASKSTTKFSCVRFGNVLGSRGSVVGIFRDQIARGGPVTVTHPEATRYFMTIPEAANLVIQAGTLAAGGEVYLLDMGEPVKIIDLARQMIRLSGFTEEQIPIKVVGTRPGEKLFEELSTTAEDIARTDLRKIFRCKPIVIDASRIAQHLDRLQFLVKARDADGVRALLRDLDIGYQVTPARKAPAEPS